MLMAAGLQKECSFGALKLVRNIMETKDTI